MCDSGSLTNNIPKNKPYSPVYFLNISDNILSMIDRAAALAGANIIDGRDRVIEPTQVPGNPDILLVNPRPFLGMIRGVSLLASVEIPMVIGRVLEAANQLDPVTVQRMHEMGTGVGYAEAAAAAYIMVNFVASNIRAKHPIPA